MAKLKYLLIASVSLLAAIAFYAVVSINNKSTIEQPSPLFGRALYANNETENQGKRADPNYQITFPADHNAHEDFDVEWWYLTANLNDQNGNEYGLQWTLFRFKDLQKDNTPNSWSNDQLYMAHASLHSKNEHWFSEKFARGGVGNAETTAQPFSLRIDDWHWQNANQDSALLPADLKVTLANTTAGKAPIHLNLRLNQTGPLVLQGDKGYSIKSASGSHASHYYSAPFIQIEGELVSQGAENKATATVQLEGKAWFDQEWTSQLLDQQTLGWDWLSLHLDNGAKIMAFRMRLADIDDFVTGSFISANGEVRTLQPADLTLEPTQIVKVDDKHLPLQWSLIIPDEGINLSVTAKKNDQWNPAIAAYYEGMVEVTGSHSGEGFLELTGYE